MRLLTVVHGLVVVELRGLALVLRDLSAQSSLVSRALSFVIYSYVGTKAGMVLPIKEAEMVTSCPLATRVEETV
jgi:hypothetical protein